MRLKNWLLAGTSLGMLALAPLPALAQNGPPLMRAYRAFVQAQNAGDAAGLQAAQDTLTQECIAAGYASLDECIAAVSARGPGGAARPGAQQPAAEQPAPAPAPEQPALAPEQPAPAAEQPAPAPAAEPAPAPVEPTPAPAAEQPVPEQPAAPVKRPRPQQPAAEQPAQPAAEQPAPAPAPEQPAAQPAPEQPAAQPAPEQPAAPAQPAADPMAQAEAQIRMAVDRYNTGVAKLAAGDASGQQAVDRASARLQQICGPLGFASNDECVANYGLALTPLPAAAPAQPAPQQPAQPAPAPQQPAAQPAPEQPAQPAAPAPQQRPQPAQPAQPAQTPETSPPAAQPPAAQAPAQPVVGGDQPVTDQAVEPLPANVTPQEAAPLLDSQKQLEQPVAPDGKVRKRPGQPGQQPGQAAQPAGQQPAQPPAAAPPKTDAEAQAGMQAPAAPPQAVTAEPGKRMGPGQFQFTPPPNAQVVPPPGGAPNQPAPNQPNQPNQPPAANPPNGGNNLANAVGQFIFQLGTQLVITNPEQDRDRLYDPNEDQIYYEQLSNGRVRETIEHPDGSKVVTIRSAEGDVIRRSRITADGREYVLAAGNDDQDFSSGNWQDPGDQLPPLRLNIPARDYVLDAGDSDQDQVEQFFAQPPVEQVQRLYTIDEVKHSARIRDSVRRLEVGDLTFDSGKATISRDQVSTLSTVANAMLDLLQRNPAETFLIEGHTDAVGTAISNLGLSDLRAATVARILTDFYHVPPENLVTQGYGEEFLKVLTDGPERLNRRVTIRRITPLITVASR